MMIKDFSTALEIVSEETIKLKVCELKRLNCIKFLLGRGVLFNCYLLLYRRKMKARRDMERTAAKSTCKASTASCIHEKTTIFYMFYSVSTDFSIQIKFQVDS